MIKHSLKINKNDIWLNALLFVPFFISCFVTNCIVENIMGFFSVLLLVRAAWKYRYNTSVFICLLFIAYSVFSIWIGVYFDTNMRPLFYQQFTKPNVYNIGMQCLFLFSIVLWNFTRKNKVLRQRKKNCDVKDNYLISILCAVFTILIVVFNFSFGTEGERASSTTLYEYKIVFCIIGMLYSKKSSLLKYMWISIIAVSCMLSFMGGNRVDAIPLIIAVIYFYYNNIDPKRVVGIVMVAIFFMVSIGAVRQTIVTEGLDFRVIIKKIVDEKFTFDTAYWAYIPALASLSISNIVPVAEKIDLFIGQLLYIFGGSKFNSYRLVFYTKNYYNHVNGFVSPIYFYMWFGLWGAVLFAIIVCGYLKWICKRKDMIKSSIKQSLIEAASAYFVSSVPRWFLYEPFGLLRGELIVVIVCLVFALLQQILTRRITIN